jgi:hypothetical protein
MSENIIKTAREAGAWTQQFKNRDVEYVMSAESLKRLADMLFEAYTDVAMAATGAAVDLAMAMEREACARVCEEVLEQYRGTDMGKHAELVGDNCAAVIRARGNKT